MLRLALIFLAIAVVAAIFGFGGFATTMAGVAKIIFFAFLVLFIVSSAVGAFRGRAPV